MWSNEKLGIIARGTEPESATGRTGFKGSFTSTMKFTKFCPEYALTWPWAVKPFAVCHSPDSICLHVSSTHRVIDPPTAGLALRTSAYSSTAIDRSKLFASSEGRLRGATIREKLDGTSYV